MNIFRKPPTRALQDANDAIRAYEEKNGEFQPGVRYAILYDDGRTGEEMAELDICETPESTRQDIRDTWEEIVDSDERDYYTYDIIEIVKL